MTTESIPRDLDAHIVSLLTKLSAIKESGGEVAPARRVPMSIEARSLELWGAVAIECFATFLFSFVVFGATESSNHILSVLTTAIASGFAIAAIFLIFGHVSGEFNFQLYCMDVKCNTKLDRPRPEAMLLTT